MSRKTYHVVKQDDQWKVKGEGAQRSSGNFGTKAEAIDRAKGLAKSNDQGQVIIHKQTGEIQTEHTYRNDPRDIPG